MLDGLDHVWKAVQFLVGMDAPLKERLARAAGEFHVSLLQPDEWPKESLSTAKEISGRLTQLDVLDRAKAQQLAEDLLSLAVDVQVAYRQDMAAE